jgi:hypothetical protein
MMGGGLRGVSGERPGVADRRGVAEQLYGRAGQPASSYLVNPKQFYALRPDQWQCPSALLEALEAIVKLSPRRLFCS